MNLSRVAAAVPLPFRKPLPFTRTRLNTHNTPSKQPLGLCENLSAGNCQGIADGRRQESGVRTKDKCRSFATLRMTIQVQVRRLRRFRRVATKQVQVPPFDSAPFGFAQGRQGRRRCRSSG